ncbi:MAG: hypothetical protein JW806_00755 [Sedimentisphaerales bacterium]|nr:hypothetical protein [Sedimentisphaerales bacterium]
MEEKLDFSLPEKKQKKSFIPALSVILLLVLIGLTAANFLKPAYKGSVQQATTSLSEDKVRELASKLAGRNLYDRAAKVWQDYLAVAEIPDAERAKTLFQIGTLFEKAGQYEQAIEYYYRSEITAKLSELESQINAHIKDCFQKLGKFSALRYELMDRTSFNKSEQAGSKIVAEIGAEKITQADLDATIEKTIDNQLAGVSLFMTAEQLNEQKQKILEQYKSPLAKKEFLQSWLMQEVLYRQALDDKLSEEPETKSVIDDIVRSALSQQRMNQELAGKINITETDLQTYYQANKTRYIAPADANDPNSSDRQKSFDQVREQVISELIGQKTKDVQQQLIKQLMDKYDVIIHNTAFTGADVK